MASLDETINIIINTIGAEKAQKQFEKLEFTLAAAKKNFTPQTASSGDLGFGSRMKLDEKRSQEAFKAIKKRLKAKVKLEQNANKAVLNERKRFKAEYLSIMFAGMALQRTFGGLFKGMIANYKEFTKESVTPLSESLTRLEANWKFLKFAMVDAASDVIGSIADWFSGVARSMSKMDPSTLKEITMVIGGLAALGGLATVFGQAALLFTSMKSAAVQKSGFTTINNTLLGMKGMPTTDQLNAGSGFFNTMSKVAGIGAIAFAVKDVFEGLDQLSDGDWLGSIYNSMAAGAKAWGGVQLMKGNVKTGGAFVLLAVAFDLLEQDKLGKTLFTIPAIIAGVIGGIVNIMAQADLRIYNTLKGGLLEYIFYPSKAKRDLLSSMKQVDFGTAFKEGFSPIYLHGMSLGEGIDNFTADLREKAKLTKDNAEQMSGEYASVWTAWQNKNSDATVKIKENTYDYIMDEDKGLKAMLKEVNKINDSLSKPINKKVYINEIRNGSSKSHVYFGEEEDKVRRNSSQSVNYWTGE